MASDCRKSAEGGQDLKDPLWPMLVKNKGYRRNLMKPSNKTDHRPAKMILCEEEEC